MIYFNPDSDVDMKNFPYFQWGKLETSTETTSNNIVSQLGSNFAQREHDQSFCLRSWLDELCLVSEKGKRGLTENHNERARVFG